MSQVLVSTKYQVVIPRDVRRQLDIHPGQKMSCIAINRVIHLVPLKRLGELRGIAKGIILQNYREKKDRL